MQHKQTNALQSKHGKKENHPLFVYFLLGLSLPLAINSERKTIQFENHPAAEQNPLPSSLESLISPQENRDPEFNLIQFSIHSSPCCFGSSVFVVLRRIR
ncbi:hypothetical protein Dimus_014766 [Dionaea muscipula]